MNEEQRKAILRETFDTVSAGYDSEALRFFPESARLLVSLLDLKGSEQVFHHRHETLISDRSRVAHLARRSGPSLPLPEPAVLHRLLRSFARLGGAGPLIVVPGTHEAGEA